MCGLWRHASLNVYRTQQIKYPMSRQSFKSKVCFDDFYEGAKKVGTVR